MAVWRRNNCQVCHQIHGFGGSLGPDLTNRVTDNVADQEFRALLAAGSGRMPPLGLDPLEQRAVLAYLRRVNRTGRSQPRPLAARRTVDRREHFRLIMEESVRRTGADLSASAGELKRGGGCTAASATRPSPWVRLSRRTCPAAPWIGR
ncbi:MAG: c-type cytochrome [Planctomycetota bacterium]